VGKDYPVISSASGRLRMLFSLVAGGAGAVGCATALADIDLQVKRGESLGLVGENGAGKSTLLKLIAGVVKPSHGTVHVNARIGALLELGSGFHPEYSGRDNIALSAALAGLSRAEVTDRIGHIIDFADIGEQIDQPVKHYSSGMVVRLGFAIATALEPEVLITDEVLAVGDESFQRKCISWMERYLGDGGTLMLCSHGMYHIQTLCQRAAWLHHGRLRAYGNSFSVTQDYLAYHEEKRRSDASAREVVVHSGENYAIRALVLRGLGGEHVEEIAMKDAVDITLEIYSPDDRPPVALVGIVRADGTPVYGTHSNEHEFSPRRVTSQRYAFGLRFPACTLLPGKYYLKGHALDSEGLRLFDTLELPFVVRGETRDYGLVRLEHEWFQPGA
jgi:lipopolysaccharide transport system ATP-binding protein